MKDIQIRNWYCPKCDRTVASVELDLRRVHTPCGTKCEFITERICSVETSQRKAKECGA